MLFLLKRTWGKALLALLVLGVLGLGLRWLLGTGPPLLEAPVQLLYGGAAFGVMLLSDGALHLLLSGGWGRPYRLRYDELAEVFRGQSVPAMVVGAAMAGVGEELLFRGLGTGIPYLCFSAVVFGLLHHVRRSLWPFTCWSIWQGLLLGLALHLTGALAVPMVAHFLHDLTGFTIFRCRRARWTGRGAYP